MRIVGNTFIVTGGLCGIGKRVILDLIDRRANVYVFDVIPQTEEQHRLAISVKIVSDMQKSTLPVQIVRKQQLY
ncbi:hypothetical protein V1511DRAFT_513339 [Dipodascopsis uninucleata]